jgi:hypothetical protein
MFRFLSQSFWSRSRNFGRVLIGSSLVFNFEEEEIKKPVKPIEFPKLENLTTEFLIKQACALSANQVKKSAKINCFVAEHC